jgi:Sulfotransferase domain
MLPDTYQASSRTALRQTDLPDRQRLQNGIRAAILSTPRSGNTWLRHLLCSIYEVPGIAQHTPAEVDWQNLPADCVLQMHWRRLPSFYERLRENDFQIIVLARHPLDVLISILHFAAHEPTTRWLEGEEGNESSIFGAMPRSTVFLDYAIGKRAAALLSVTPQWWAEPDCLQIHYESLVEDPQTVLKFVLDTLGGEPKRTVAEVVEANTIPRLRRLTQCDRHFWQGRPGLWRTLLTTTEADMIGAAHGQVFTELGYSCDPNPKLEPLQADGNWIELAWNGLVDDLQNVRIVKREAANSQMALQATSKELLELKHTHHELWMESRALRAELEKAQSFIAQCDGLGPQSIQLARQMKTFGERHPRLLAILRAIISPL